MAFSEMNGMSSAGVNKPRVNSNRRTFRLLSKVGTPKWVSNNRCLAKENAKYRKEIQKLTKIVSEQSIRYRRLEMSWLHRGEALSKIDVAAATLGNHFMKIIDTLKDIRSVCQKEINSPFPETFAKDNLAHLRKSMPNMKLDSLSSNTKGQLVNHVNPMVSGIPIITKPTITLKRLKVRHLQQNREPAPSVHVPTTDSDSDESSDANMGAIPEVSSGGQEMEENSETSSEGPPSPPSNNRTPVMRVAEVPLERLSLSSLSGTPRRSSGVLSGCIIQGDGTVVINSSVQGEKQDTPSNIVYQTTTTRISTGNSPSIETTKRGSMGSVQRTKCVIDQTNRQQILYREVYKSHNTRPDSPTPRKTSSGSRSSIRKYSGSNHAKSSGPSTPKNGMNKYNVAFKPLIIALKDVGSYLQNGRLVGIDQLEEGKIKTGVSAEQKQQHIGGRTHDNEITLIDSPENDQTHLNFTAGIGTLEYTRTSVGEEKEDDCMDQNATFSQDDFHKRIANEDPLEGPSWRYEDGAASRGSRRSSYKRSYHACIPKQEEDDQSLMERMYYHRISEKQDKPVTLSEKNRDSVEMVDMDITNSVNMINVSDSSDFSSKSCLEKASNVEKTKANNKEISKKKQSEAENSSDAENSDADWKPSHKRKSEQRKHARMKESKTKIGKKSVSHRNVSMKVNTVRGSGSSRHRSSSADKSSSRKKSGDVDKTLGDMKLTQAVVRLEILTPEQNTTEATVQETGRAKRRAAPKTFREVSLGRKLRRGDSFFQ